MIARSAEICSRLADEAADDGRGHGGEAEQADAALSQLTLLAGAGMAETAAPHLAAVPAPHAGPGPGTPLHAAIPPLHLSA